MGSPYEAVDYNDPLSLLLQAEDEEAECDVLHSQYDAGRSKAKTSEVERTTGDMLGASPVELAAQHWLH
jgi:hypothetical protein